MIGPKPGFPDLYLMRHGQTVWNAEGRLQGRMESPLTALGRHQARRQAQLVQGIAATRHASNAGRAVETAQIVYAGQDFRQDARLHEIDIGEFTGRVWAELRTQHPEVTAGGWLDWYDRAPGGELFAGVETRARAFLAELTGPALIVTHGITLRMLRLIAMDLPLSRLGEMPVMQGALHVVSAGQHRMVL